MYSMWQSRISHYILYFLPLLSLHNHPKPWWTSWIKLNSFCCWTSHLLNGGKAAFWDEREVSDKCSVQILECSLLLCNTAAPRIFPWRVFIRPLSVSSFPKLFLILLSLTQSVLGFNSEMLWGGSCLLKITFLPVAVSSSLTLTAGISMQHLRNI